LSQIGNDRVRDFAWPVETAPDARGFTSGDGETGGNKRLEPVWGIGQYIADSRIIRSGQKKMNQLKSKHIKRYRLQMASLMLFADLLGFSLTGVLIYLLNYFLHFFILQLVDLKYLVVVLFCLALFMSSRLYPGVGINPADEIRMVTQFVSIGFMLGLIFFISTNPNWRLNSWALVPSWMSSLVLVLLSRWGVRIFSVKFGLWGEPVVMIGKGAQINQLTHYFLDRRRLGFVPVLVAADLTGIQTIPSILSIDLNNLTSLPDEYFSKDDIQTALVDISSVSNLFQADAGHALFRLFHQVIFISDVDWLEGASLRIHDFEGLIGMGARNTSLSPLNSVIKRGLDVGVSLLGGVLLMPFFLILTALIKLDSPGPVLYSQERIGRNGNRIKVYKFRSMQQNADQALAACLANSHEARLEWDRSKKLKNDPRCTRIGKWIRKFSIDETPQLLNILKGDMSLVGPRPLPDYHYNILSDKARSLREAVSPGLTGMWQVSGRSNTRNDELETLDAYYIHNWSLWLDVYILLRTVWVVLSRDGAY
jgi:Undecaprenyl-phosphate galactose phosphotransferase WbaP